jgi:hypothetical protein
MPLRGAKPSPRHKAFAAPAHKAGPVPPSFGVIPPRLSFWDNNNYGDCVSAEEAAAKAIYSLMHGGTTELFITQDEVIKWADAHGWLNGANLTEVMEAMAKSGMVAEDGKTYGDGPYVSVDWTNDATLSSAIYTGPVKIGVAADQLLALWRTHESNGWVATGFHEDKNEDHCVCLCGFGSMQELCAMFHALPPAGIDPATRSYLLFTWNSIGVIDSQSMIAITSEAWLRTPTTILQKDTTGKAATPLVAGSQNNVESLKQLLSGILGLLNS